MKKYVYPVILFYSEEEKNYTVLIPDLDIVASGETVEKAYLSAEDYLETFLDFAEKMESPISPATTFDDTQRMNLYKTYADELEELVWKFKSFNLAFKEQLTDRFKKLFPIHATRNDIIRFLYGFYSKEKDVHKRPLTKVKQDVAKQLGMI